MSVRPRIRDDLVERIDEMRGDIPRDRFINRMLEEGLGLTPKPSEVKSDVDACAGCGAISRNGRRTHQKGCQFA